MPEAVLGSQGFTILIRIIIAKMLKLVTSINMCVVINLIVLLSYCLKTGLICPDLEVHVSVCVTGSETTSTGKS